MKYSCKNGWTEYTTIEKLIDNGQFPESKILELAILLDKKISFEKIYNYFEEKRADFLPIVIFNGYNKNDYDSLQEEIIDYSSSEDSDEGDFFNMIVMALFCAKGKYFEKWNKYLNYNENKNITLEEKMKLLENVINYVLEVLDISPIEVCEYHYLESEAKWNYYDKILYNHAKRKVYLLKDAFYGYAHEPMFNWILSVVSKIMLLEIEEYDDFNDYLNIGASDIRELMKNPEKFSKVYNSIASVLKKYYQIYERKE